ncbi:hypothetical protein M378DRAFT_996020 [Amanita muscaria Koide BX008]|uniref:Uncharacterized protein n=1 Tax=Amanita muscaria (strain Koide BX008) TaxID=946122 RepID=A0A0C2WE71_AMAMK|nr:hypothetical protein M378DRAFT_996020 [Amanita muscaria Koide BX008]
MISISVCREEHHSQIAQTAANVSPSTELHPSYFSSVHVVVLPVYVFVIFKQSPLRYINHATMTDANKIEIGNGFDAEGSKAIAVGAAVSAFHNVDATGTRKSKRPSEVKVGENAKLKNASGMAIGHAATARSKDGE